jgi:hypothetical protein
MKIALYVLKQKVPPSASWSASCRALQLRSITSEGLLISYWEKRCCVPPTHSDKYHVESRMHTGSRMLASDIALVLTG